VDSVDQLRQDFWNGAACRCDTHKALEFSDFLVRDQEVGGSNPLAPTIVFNDLHVPSGFSTTAL